MVPLSRYAGAMTGEEAYEALSAALRRANDARIKGERELAELRAKFDQLNDILVGRQHLTEGHKHHLERVGQTVANAEPRKVRLRQYIDKYAIPPTDIDCRALFPLCQGRCCSFSFELTTQDLDEGKVRWEVLDPYLIRHEKDGYCSHRDRKTFDCTVYENRPAVCRQYDCRGDARVWIDFDKRIPAPMPGALERLK